MCCNAIITYNILLLYTNGINKIAGFDTNGNASISAIFRTRTIYKNYLKVREGWHK